VTDSAETAAVWDAQADTFDDEPDHGLREPATREAWRRLLTDALPDAPSRVADLGCGTGTLSRLLAEDGHTVDGVDLSPRMVDAARAKCAGLPVTAVVGDAAAPPLDDGANDVVLARHVLWALPDPADAVRRWAGLLAPGGRLVLVEGFWHTGAGLTGDQTLAAVRAHREQAVLTRLTDPLLWGGPVSDERYQVLSLG
jgi:SAM-dependent methyltransferase